MVNLGIIRGMTPDGDFALESGLTRAQLVTVIVRAFGREEDAKLLQGTPIFPDTADHWASGNIAMAKELLKKAGGDSMGFPDGTFQPDSQLTSAQAVAFLMKFLGIPRDSELSWPQDYLQSAIANGLIPDDLVAEILGAPNEPASRGLAFYLLDRAFSSYEVAPGETTYTKYVDSDPPVLTVNSLPAETTDETVSLTGTVSGEDELTVNGQSAGVAADGSWSHAVTLVPGANSILVKATDLAGNAATQTVSIARRVPPAGITATLTPNPLRVGETARLSIDLKDADGNSVAAPSTVTISGAIGTYDSATNTFTAATVPATGSLTAKAGELEATVNVTVMAGLPTAITISPSAPSVSTGGSTTFTAAGTDKYGNPADMTGLVWSAERGSITATGDYAAPAASGSDTVTATLGDLTATASVSVYTPGPSVPRNHAPIGLTLTAAVVTENRQAGTSVGFLQGVDSDQGDTFTYSLVSGAGDTDNSRFQIVGNELKTAAPLDFEAQEIYSIRVRVRDQRGGTYECNFGITALDENDPPSAPALSNDTVAENQPDQTLVASLSGTTDQDGDLLTFSLVGDPGPFAVSGTNLVTTTALDYETTQSYDLTIRASDGTAETDATFTIDVVDGPDAPTAIQLSTTAIDENQSTDTVVATLSVDDPDAGDTHTLTIDSGGDAFQISGDGTQLLTNGPFDYETQPSYSLTITATDSASLAKTSTFSISINNVNEAPMAIALSNGTVAENESGAAVGTLTATDDDVDDIHTFRLVNGEGDTDNTSFQIADDDVVKTTTALDFETRSTYSIRVQAEDQGGATFETALTITALNGNDAPSEPVLSNLIVVNENQAAGVVAGNLSATDPDGGTVTFSVLETGGPFAVSGTNLVTTEMLDYEGAPSHQVTVRASDGTAYTDKIFTVAVGNVNDAPTAIALSNDTIAEDALASALVGTLSAVDQDLGDTHTYALEPESDAGFAISDDQLLVSSPLDRETKSTYSLTIKATDSAGQSKTATFAITVTNVNEAPTGLALSSVTTVAGTADALVGTLTTTDLDTGDTHTYSIVNDDGSFKIVGDQLKTNQALAQGDYTVTVSATDSGGLSVQRTFTITAANSAPVAAADSFTLPVGNTLLAVSSTVTGQPVYSRTGNLLGNDSDADSGDTLSAVAETVDTSLGGKATINADGSFTYTPPAGQKGKNDTFSYTVSDGKVQSTGTVTITIGSGLVWYVDSSSTAATHDGRSATPFTDMSSLPALGADDILFVYAGSYTPSATIQLGSNGKLLGQPAGLVIDGQTLVAAGGANPTIQGTVGLGEGAQVSAVDLSSAGNALVSSGVNSATVNADASVSGGVSLSGGNGTMSIGAPISLNGQTITVAGRSGTQSFTSTISGNGSILLETNTAGSTTFSGRVALTSTGVPTLKLTGNSANHLVTLSGASSSLEAIGAQAIFGDTGGRLVISGAGTMLSAQGSGAVSLTGIITDITVAGITATNVPSGSGVAVKNQGTASTFTVTGGIQVSELGTMTAAIDIDTVTNAAFTFGTVNLTGGTYGIRVLNGANTNVAITSLVISGVRRTEMETYDSVTRMPTTTGDGDGIYLSGVTGSFTVSGSATITAPGGHGVDVRNAGTVNLDDLTVISPQMGGVQVTGTTNLTLSSPQITGFGSQTCANISRGCSGIRLRSITGTVTVSGASQINGKAGITDINYVDDYNVYSGIDLYNVGTVGTLSVTGATFTNIQGSAVRIENSGSGSTVTATVTYNTVDGARVSVYIMPDAGSRIVAKVQGNTLQRATDTNVYATAYGTNNTGTLLDLTLTGNTGSDATSADFATAVYLGPYYGATFRVLMQNNIFTVTNRNGTKGLLAQAQYGATLHLTSIGDKFSGANWQGALITADGNQTVSDPVSVVHLSFSNVDLRGNNLVGGGYAVHFANVRGGIFDVYPTGATVQDSLLSTNPLLSDPSVNFYIGGTITTTGTPPQQPQQ